MTGRSSGPKYQRPNIDFRTPVWLIKYLKKNKIQKSTLFRGILLHPSRILHYPSVRLLGVQLHFYTVDYLSKIKEFSSTSSYETKLSFRSFCKISNSINQASKYKYCYNDQNNSIILWIALYESADWLHSAQDRDGSRAFVYTAITLRVPHKTSNSLTS